MFVALRDLRFARGRFALISSVIVLITILVGFLSGLAGGLAWQNVSGILALPFDKMVLAASDNGAATDFSSSSITQKQADTWAEAEGVTSATPVGITTSRAESESGEAAITIVGYGASPNQELSPEATVADIPRSIVLSTGAADALDAQIGDTVTIAGFKLLVSAVGDDWWYSHTPVAYTSLADWQDIAATQREGTIFATGVAVTGSPQWDQVASNTHTTAKGQLASLTAIPAFASEVGSLGMMIAMLFSISALVIGAFFTVWTIQRSGDIAILKALGAATRTLMKDALGQAGVVLATGVAVGVAAVIGVGAIVPAALPFLVSPLTTALPAALLVILGLAGAAVGVRSVTSVNPLSALGGAR
ncbi:ABC transporter permease [Demequina aurantiaca]|uniref:ABC transporter permease n=1 Tax=Demequina aurantiaca TaxID=676200 RepID=UPI0007865D60|nr:ABC transporter permease [Demequina aurantiaca]